MGAKNGGHMNTDKKIPEFENYEAITEFWDNHSLADYWDQTKPAEFQVSLTYLSRSTSELGNKKTTNERT
jgi:hypothetical protein